MTHRIPPQSIKCMSLMSSKATRDSSVVRDPSLGPSDLTVTPDPLTIPSRIPQASRVMIEMEGTHCSPMPASFFRLPWNLPHSNNGFVYVSKPEGQQTQQT